VVMPAT